VALGGPEQVAAQLGAQLAAGADHVCVQLLTAADADPTPGYERLAVALGL
jgi:alkanesulfonate monooxygenase SsuD/methylene tetrahydromethanopterin reductase-like flavin-dependent oxidoreductase (luciferase family)